MTTHYFETVNEVLPLLNELEAGDVILVKASRAEHFEELADSIIDRWNNEEGERI
jgi:UDP-N-acetylmuramoyl-tripeptide--D-alanyl-D-alanine ligase